MGTRIVKERRIFSDTCVAEGAEWLKANDPCMAQILDQTGALPLRLRDDGFAALLHAIVGQQVSVASANAIWGRVDAAKLSDRIVMQSATDEDLQAAGLSRPKQKYARALAQADIDYAALHDTPSDDVIATLIKQPGIGTWTAEIYAMFSLGRADVFAHGDLALQEAARVALDLPKRPTEKEMRAIAESWSPWRSVAARALWAYYRVMNAREGVA